MAETPDRVPPDQDEPLLPPAPIFFSGLVLTAVGWLLSMAMASNSALGVVLILLGLVMVGLGLSYFLTSCQNPGDRFLSTRCWFLAATAALVGSFGLQGPADSLAFLTRILAMIAAVAGVLSAIPVTWRWVAVSLLLIFHLFALFTATTIAPPTAGPPPWLAMQLWTRYTRPYLQFLHLNNAYHFYAPEPGPVALLWFRVRFTDNAVVWVRLPNHQRCTSHIERRRQGALASTLSQSSGSQPTPQQIAQRDAAGRLYNPPLARPDDIPLEIQYHDPGPAGRLLIASLTRHIARTTTHPTGENSPIASVRCYRGEFTNPPVEHFADGRPFLDPTLYRVWYFGEYDPDGAMRKSSEMDLLYWLLPIQRITKTPPVAPLGGPQDRPPGVPPYTSEGELLNAFRIHAGDGNLEEIP